MTWVQLTRPTRRLTTTHNSRSRHPIASSIYTGTKEISGAHACVQAKTLRHKMNKSPKYLSGAGEKMAQQLGILAALVQDPGLVLSTGTPGTLTY